MAHGGSLRFPFASHIPDLELKKLSTQIDTEGAAKVSHLDEEPGKGSLRELVDSQHCAPHNPAEKGWSPPGHTPPPGPHTSDA